MKKNKLLKTSILGISINQAISSFLLALLFFVVFSLGAVVYFKGKNIVAYMQDDYRKKAVVGFKNYILNFLENHLSVLESYSKFPVFVHSVMQPEESIADLTDFLKDISFFGKVHQLVLVDYQGDILYAKKQQPLFDYTQEHFVKNVLSGKGSKYIEISCHQDIYYWRLCVPVNYNNKTEGALILEIPVKEVDFKKQLGDMLLSSQLKILSGETTVAIFGESASGEWKKNSLYQDKNIYISFRLSVEGVENLYLKSAVELIVFFALLLVVSVIISIRFAKKIFADPLKDFQKITSSLMQGSNDFSLSTDQRIYELKLLASNFKDMFFAVNHREQKLKTEIEERKKIEEALEKSKQHFKRLIEITPFAIILVDSEKNIIEINRTALDLFEIENKDALMGSKACFFTCGNYQGPCLVCPNDRLIDKEESCITTATKKVIPVLKSVRSIFIDGNKYLLQTFVDISTRKRIEQDNLSLEKELHQSRKLEAIGTLSAGIAHEINTPVQFVNDYVSFIGKAIVDLFTLIQKYKDIINNQMPEKMPLLDSLEQDLDIAFLKEELPEAISNSQEGLERITSIVKAMRDFSHVGIEGEKTASDINKAIESTITITKNEWKYVAEIKTDYDKSLPLVPCFVGDIKQVILNLIVNAAHSIKEKLGNNPNDKGIITVTTKQEDEGTIVIAIADTGCGIELKNQPKIFDQFFTTKEVGKGTGQGLSMAYATIVQKHKGSIDFETEVGKGTTFFVRLPIQIEV